VAVRPQGDPRGHLHKGFDTARNAFTQAYGSRELDAAVLMIAHRRFPSRHGPACMVSTVELIERELVRTARAALPDSHDGAVDGLPPGEGTFLPCSFWLADCLHLMGRHDDARGLYEHLLGRPQRPGVLSEEYDPSTAPAGQLPAGLLARCLSTPPTT